MDRYSDIVELLSFVEEDISQIDVAYEVARKDESQLQVLRPKIKSCFENLRSSLEYSAQDIWASYTKKKNSVYFPYGKNEQDFLVSTKKNLPALKEQRSDIFSLIERLQPHACGDDWLYELCKHTNFNKHNRLSHQVRKNSSKSTTTFGNILRMDGAGAATFQDCYVGNQPMAKNGTFVFSSGRKVAEMNEDLNVTIPILREFDWVEFELHGSVYDVLKLLRISHLRISEFTVELKKLLS